MIGSICKFALNNWFNYKTVNINNFYNFVYLTLERASEEDKKQILKDIKIIVGMEFFSGLLNYIMRKSATDSLLKYFT